MFVIDMARLALHPRADRGRIFRARGKEDWTGGPAGLLDPIECIDCGLRDFRAGQPTRKVEALHRNKREFVHGGKSTPEEYAKHKAAE